MRLLLDTHLIYWSYYESHRVPVQARRLMDEAERVFVSSASVWEIAIKSRLGKIKADSRRIVEHIEAAGFYELPVRMQHAVNVANMPMHHTDPFDRLLIAQAVSEPLHLVTADSMLKIYSEMVIVV
jgi:PIN domain nuclease of toxin-antitoxin system